MQIRSDDRTRIDWRTPRWWAQDTRWLALAAPLLLFAAHSLYGAMLPRTALTVSFLGALLLGASLLNPQVRRELDRVRGLAAPIAGFALVVLLILWSLTPWAPGGPHPVWDFAGISPSATTLDKSQTILELLKLLGLAAFFGLGLAAGASDGRARLTVNIVILLGAAFALWAFLSFANGALGPGARRLGAAFNLPNPAATLFGVLLLMTLGAGVSTARSTPSRRRFTATAPFFGAALILSVALLATASRGGFTATAAGLVAFGTLQAFSGQVKLSRTAAVAMATLVIGALLLALTGEQLINRLLGQGWDDNGRDIIFRAHWGAFKGAPVMGYGLGSFDTLNRLLLDAINTPDLWLVRAAHSVYLSWLEQAGVLGAFAMFGTIAAILLITLRHALRRSRFTAPLFSLLAASVVVLVHGFSDFSLETYSIAATWSLLLGLGFSSAQGSAAR